MCDGDLFSVFFFFKQKTAYEMRISDWSSDVCSSDLRTAGYSPDDAGGLDGLASPCKPFDATALSASAMSVSIALARASISFAALSYRVSKSGSSLQAARSSRGTSRKAARINNPCDNGCRSAEHTSELQSLMTTSYAVS